MLTFVHSRRFGYAALVTAVLILELAFAWRVSLVYGEVLKGQASPAEVWVLKAVLFFAVAAFGFVLATHRHYGVASIRKRAQKGQGWGVAGVFVAVLVIVLHDWGAAIYTTFGQGEHPSFGLIAVTVGMCGLVLVPFLIGQMSLAMAESLKDEKQEAHEEKRAKLLNKQELQQLRTGANGARKGGSVANGNGRFRHK